MRTVRRFWNLCFNAWRQVCEAESVIDFLDDFYWSEIWLCDEHIVDDIQPMTTLNKIAAFRYEHRYLCLINVSISDSGNKQSATVRRLTVTSTFGRECGRSARVSIPLKLGKCFKHRYLVNFEVFITSK